MTNLCGINRKKLRLLQVAFAVFAGIVWYWPQEGVAAVVSVMAIPDEPPPVVPDEPASAVQAAAVNSIAPLLAPVSAPLAAAAQALANVPVSVKQFGAVGDGYTDDTQAIKAAIKASRNIFFPAGIYLISGGIIVPDNTHLYGADRDTTILKVTKRAINMFELNDSSSIEHLTLDGVFDDPDTGSSGVVMIGKNSQVIDVASNNQGYHGFVIYKGASGNSILHSSANNCGDRGINISESSHDNIVDDFTSVGCAKAGVLIGYNSYNNRISHLKIKGVGHAAIWVHMGSYNNVFTDVEIGPASRDGKDSPQMIVGSGAHDNTFENFRLTGGTDHVLYIWNLPVNHPELGTVDRPIEGNVFSDFSMTSLRFMQGRAISFLGDSSHVIKKNIFRNFFINGFATVAYNGGGVAEGQEFLNFTFGRRKPNTFFSGETKFFSVTPDAGMLLKSRISNVEGMPDSGE